MQMSTDQVLRSIVSESLTCLVSEPGRDKPGLRGRLANIDQDTLHVRLVANGRSWWAGTISVVAVTFVQNENAGCFLAHVDRMEGSDLWLSRPHTVAMLSQRRHQRFRVGNHAQIQVTVHWSGHEIAYEALDLSASGVGCRVPLGTPSPSQGTRVRVVIQMDTQAVELAGRVARCRGDEMGILLLPGNSDERTTLRRLVETQFRTAVAARMRQA